MSRPSCGTLPPVLNPSEPRGTYALLLELDQQTVITVGRLGTCSFPAGSYVYVGSALGSGGLSARLAHHRRPVKRFHYSILTSLVCSHHRVS